MGLGDYLWWNKAGKKILGMLPQKYKIIRYELREPKL